MARAQRGTTPVVDDRHLPASLRGNDDGGGGGGGGGHQPLLPSADAASFLRVLQRDLSVQRIDDVFHHLWLVGRPLPPRPLSTQRVLERAVVATNDTSLHLVWATDKIYVKPLPSCLRSHSFYEQHLRPVSDLTRPALGLLYSYISLVPTELDFGIAQEAALLPRTYEWDAWRRLVRRVLSDHPDGLTGVVPRRYRYGELRLSRLDKIYRCTRGQWLHGYSRLTGSSSYLDFVGKNIAVIGTCTIYLVVILTAMQLGKETKTLENDETFERASYGFAIFAICLPLIAFALIAGVFLFMVVANYINTIRVQRQQLGHRGGAKRSRKRDQAQDPGLEMFAVNGTV